MRPTADNKQVLPQAGVEAVFGRKHKQQQFSLELIAHHDVVIDDILVERRQQHPRHCENANQSLRFRHTTWLPRTAATETGVGSRAFLPQRCDVGSRPTGGNGLLQASRKNDDQLRLAVVREVASDLVLAVEEDDFCRHVAAGAPVLQDEAVNPDEQLHRLEMERGVLLEPRGEVARSASFPASVLASLPVKTETSGETISTSSV